MDGGDVAADGSKVYRGQNAYRQYTGKSESFDNQVMSGAGPSISGPYVNSEKPARTGRSLIELVRIASSAATRPFSSPAALDHGILTSGSRWGVRHGSQKKTFQ